MIPQPPLEVPFTQVQLAPGEFDNRPILNVTIGTAPAAPFDALLDTGATINVLPYSAGLQLGLDWKSQSLTLNLGGIFSTTKAFGVVLPLQFGGFPPTLMVFAWIDNDQAPVILGRRNFFAEYDVCFFLAHGTFAIQTKRP